MVNSLGSFLWCPIKGPLVCGFSPFLHMITLNPLPLCSSRSHKYNNYEKATYIVSSNLCLFTCTQPRSQAFHEIPIHRGKFVQRMFLKFIHLFLVLTFQIIYQYPGSESTLKTEHETT